MLKTRRHLPPADIWASGCVFYCMLTGRPPFRFTTMSQTAKKIQKLDFEIPMILSYEARKIISGILTDKPAIRLTINQIQKSSLFTKYQPRASFVVLSDHTNVSAQKGPVVPLKPKFTLEPQREQKI